MVNKKSLIILSIIMILIWLLALIIVSFIYLYIPPLQNPVGTSGPLWDLITDSIKVIIPVILVIAWLYIWHILIRMFFWRTLKTNNEEKKDESED